jgi:hypothetical protein
MPKTQGWIQTSARQSSNSWLPTPKLATSWPVRAALERSASSGLARARAEATGSIFLLNVFTKGDRANLSKAEQNELRVILGKMADAYRKGPHQ